MKKIILIFSQIILFIFFLSLFGWSVKQVYNNKKEQGVISKALKVFVSYPDIFSKAVAEVQKLPDTFVETKKDFSSVNKLEKDLIVLSSYTSSEKHRVIELKNLKNWPDRVKIMQNNWIGKSDGATINFSIDKSDEKIEIAKANGCDYVINYSKENFAEKVKEITNGVGVPVVYDGVGKKTFDGSIECLKVRGMMVSFGNASGPLSDINVPKVIQPKGLYLVRPSMQQYLSTREELDEASKTMFEKISSGKISVKIAIIYSLMLCFLAFIILLNFN